MTSILITKVKNALKSFNTDSSLKYLPLKSIKSSENLLDIYHIKSQGRTRILVNSSKHKKINELKI